MTRRIAVLGGGAASLFATWSLVRTEPRAYDITIYQLGWRLGGKGASGRRMTSGDRRIEEHGLHLMFGFYENVFRMLREAYAETYRDDAMWRRFFKSERTEVTMIRYLDEQRTRWEPWPIPYPSASTNRTPGDGGQPYDGSGMVAIVRNALSWLEGLVHVYGGSHPALSRHLGDIAFDVLRALIDEPLVALLGPVAPWSLARQLVERVTAHAPVVALIPHYVEAFEKALGLGERALEQLWPHLDDLALPSLVKFVVTVIRGLFADFLVRGSTNWFELDRYDLKDWIERHGGDRHARSVEGLYDAVFASYGKLGAGSILQAATKAAFLFKGSAIYKMQAGMGDTIFTPLYLALIAHGVKFKFFHRVESVAPSVDGQFVESVDLERQVDVDAYDPLIDVDVNVGGPIKLKCWPSEPLWDRLPDAEARRVRDGRIDLENHWTERAGELVTIRRGADFDDVILGISVAALPELCPELLRGDARLGAHVETLARETVATQAMQLWTVPGRVPEQPNPLIVPNVDPYDTIADMCHLIPAECHEAGTVGGVHYLCSALKPEDDEEEAELDGDPVAQGLSFLPPRTDRDYPAKLARLAVENGRLWVTERAPILWRNLVHDGGFDWSALHDPQGRSGPDRFDAQFVSTPRNPSDRYVIPAPGTHEHRLMTNQTTYENLYITGDWIKTSLSIGCLEAAAMAGIQTARAVSLETGNRPVPRAWGDWIEDVIPRTERVAPRPGTAAPRYRRRDGELLVPPPYGVKCDGLYMFVLRADPARLRAVCDNDLNIGGPHYRPYADIAILYGSRLSHLAVGSAGDAQEIGIWLPVLADGDPTIRIYSPYIWLDSATSTIVGRSVYGYTKLTGNVTVPRLDDRQSMSVVADCLVTTRDGMRLERAPLLTASAAPGAPSPRRELASWPMLARLVTQLAADPGGVLRLLSGMKSVFLKQLPHVAGPTAAYQVIVEADITTRLQALSGRTLADPWTIEIPSRLEPRLVERLGLDAHTTHARDELPTAVVTPIVGLSLRFEGTLQPGVVIYRSI